VNLSKYQAITLKEKNPKFLDTEQMSLEIYNECLSISNEPLREPLLDFFFNEKDNLSAQDIEKQLTGELSNLKKDIIEKGILFFVGLYLAF